MPVNSLCTYLVVIESMHKHSCEPAGLKREWIIGQHLNKLRGPKGELQGAHATGKLTFAVFQSCLASALHT